MNTYEDLASLEEFRPTFLVNAADKSPLLPMALDYYSKNTGIPYVALSVGTLSGYWGPIVVPGMTKCLQCYQTEELQQMSEDEIYIYEHFNETIKGSFGPTNTITSTFASMDIIHYVAGELALCKSLGRRCTYDFREGIIITDSLPTEVCGCWS